MNGDAGKDRARRGKTNSTGRSECMNFWNVLAVFLCGALLTTFVLAMGFLLWLRCKVKRQERTKCNASKLLRDARPLVFQQAQFHHDDCIMNLEEVDNEWAKCSCGHEYAAELLPKIDEVLK